MKRERQISARISSRTSERLDMCVRETGTNRGRVIEDALNEHLDALEGLPADAIIPTRIVLTQESGEEFLRDLESHEAPTEALRRLMSGS
jgi:predicted DNA-binding protein